MAKKYVKRKTGDDNKNAIVILSIVVAVSVILGVVIAFTQPQGGGGGSAQSGLPNEELIQSYKTQLQNNPDDVGIRTELGHAYFEQGMALYQKGDNRMNEKFNLAINEYLQVLKKNPKDKAVLGNLAVSYFYTGRTDDALREGKKALEIDPKFEPALMNYAIFLNSKGETAEAIKYLEKIPPGAQNYGQAQQLLSDFKKQTPVK